jgi:hypothetical protein
LFHHFKIEPRTIRAEYFENSPYFHIYDANFKAKTKNSERVGSKRSLQEEEDKTLKSIQNLRKKMKKMKAQFHPSEVDEKEDNLVVSTEDSVKDSKNIEKNTVFNIDDTSKNQPDASRSDLKRSAKRINSSRNNVKRSAKSINASESIDSKNSTSKEIFHIAPNLAFAPMAANNFTIGRESTEKERKKEKNFNSKSTKKTKKTKKTSFVIEL